MNEKTKKGLIWAGIAAAGIAGVILLTRKPAAAEPVYICPYCPQTFGSLDELMQHISLTHPQQPPPQFGRIIAYIKDAATGVKVVNARISMDGVPDGLSNIDGIYASNYIAYGSHTLLVQADNYESQTVNLNLDSQTIEVQILLQPISVPPPPAGDWTEGVTVRQIEVTPSTVYLGQPVSITVYIDYPTPIPETVRATISIDGVRLSGDFPTTFARVNFAWTPQMVGEYTVTAQNKSAQFTVLQDIPAAYYSPFGGTRMPLCTQIVVPDVNAYRGHPGGDLTYNGLSLFVVDTWIRRAGSEQQLYRSRATQWTLGVVNNYVIDVELGYMFTILVMAVNYTCQQYWDSKDELAKMIVGYTKASTTPPQEWIVEYGTTCPTCGGTGQVWVEKRRRYDTCPTCHGLGKVLNVSLSHGIRDWVKEPFLQVNCFQGNCTYWIDCPYCGQRIESPIIRGSWTTAEKVAFIRGDFFPHLETRHPDHPLTQPAQF